MKIATQIEINAPINFIWHAICDIENAENMIEAINWIKVIDKPEQGLVGLKWQEARTMYGKEALETMWITEAQENYYYQTRAESHGSVYISRMEITANEDSCILTMGFTGHPQTLVAKVMSMIMTPFFKGSIVKMLQQDLQDIKRFVEEKAQV